MSAVRRSPPSITISRCGRSLSSTVAITVGVMHRCVICSRRSRSVSAGPANSASDASTSVAPFEPAIKHLQERHVEPRRAAVKYARTSARAVTRCQIGVERSQPLVSDHHGFGHTRGTRGEHDVSGAAAEDRLYRCGPKIWGTHRAERIKGARRRLSGVDQGGRRTGLGDGPQPGRWNRQCDPPSTGSPVRDPHRRARKSAAATSERRSSSR